MCFVIRLKKHIYLSFGIRVQTIVEVNELF